jgi:hypothetical protein
MNKGKNKDQHLLEVCNKLGIDPSVLENENLFRKVLKDFQKERILQIRLLEKENNEYIKEYSKEVEVYLKLDEKVEKPEENKDFLLDTLKRLEKFRNKKSKNIPRKIKIENIVDNE